MIVTYENSQTDKKSYPDLFRIACGHHGRLRYYGLNRYATVFLQGPLLLVGIHYLVCSTNGREPRPDDIALSTRPNMAAIPDRPTSGRGTTSGHTLHNQNALLWQQPLVAPNMAASPACFFDVAYSKIIALIGTT